jgi:phosphoenolpyruvate synthase/pyruvate phosphate dikinase
MGTGRYTGTARIVLGPDDFARVADGDVVVAAATNPGYSVIFGLARAVVTEHGGPLSHAAIVARELGIPAVVGCRGATSSIRDGQEVTVDAATGVVRIA